MSNIPRTSRFHLDQLRVILTTLDNSNMKIYIALTEINEVVGVYSTIELAKAALLADSFYSDWDDIKFECNILERTLDE